MASRIPQRFAHALLRLYPPAWRRRYADEMRSLIEDSQPGWGATLNLAASAAREWVSPTCAVWPTKRVLVRAYVTLYLILTAGPVGLTWVSFKLGETLQAWFGVLPQSVALVPGLLSTAMAFWLTTGAIRNGVALLRGSPRLPVGLQRSTVIAVILFMFVVGILESAARDPQLPSPWWVSAVPYVRAFTLGSLLEGQSARMARVTRAFNAVHRRTARQNLLRYAAETLNLHDGGSAA